MSCYTRELKQIHHTFYVRYFGKCLEKLRYLENVSSMSMPIYGSRLYVIKTKCVDQVSKGERYGRERMNK